jgi:hypothetical protein
LRTTAVPGAYFRSSTRIVLVLYALPLCLSLTLVVLEPVWNRLLFLLLSVLLLAANLDTLLRIRPVVKATGSNVLLLNEAFGTLAVLVLVTLPWILGGLEPTREDLTWAFLLSLASAFLSVGVIVLSVFDTARYEAAAARVQERDRDQQPREAGAEAGQHVAQVMDAEVEAAESDRGDEQRQAGEHG